MVSVIIPDCIDGIYLQRCINSVIRQTYEDIEIIAVWPDKGEIRELPKVQNIIAEKDLSKTVGKICDIANGRYLFFLSYYSVLAPNCIEELVKSGGSEEECYYANEVYVGEKTVDPQNMFTNMLQGKLYDKDVLRNVLDRIGQTYYQSSYIWNGYKSGYSEVKNNPDAYYYTTLDEGADREYEQITYDETLLKNTVVSFDILDEDSKTKVEKAILEKIKVNKANEDTLREIFYAGGLSSFELTVNYVINSYSKNYSNACRNLDQETYDRVKDYLIRLENAPELLAIVLKKLGLTYWMYKAMKHLDVDNFKFIVGEGALPEETDYPDDLEDQQRTELHDNEELGVRVDLSETQIPISVVIPDCTDGLYLQRCINSVLRQTYKNIEIIAVWSDKNEVREFTGVKNILADKSLSTTINRICNMARGEYIFFLSYYSVPAPNCIEELANSITDGVYWYRANGVYVGENPVVPEKMYSNYLQGILFDKDCLKKITDSLGQTYCQSIYIRESYKDKYSEIKDSSEAYYYTTLNEDATREYEQITYDPGMLKNTLINFDVLDEDSKIYVDNAIVENIKIDDENKKTLHDIVSANGKSSFNLMMTYVIDSYIDQYKDACRNLDQKTYDRVKEFLIGFEDQPELHNIALKKLGMSEEMYSAMKHLDVHNYRFVVEDNTLFIASVYPEGMTNLQGVELADYVVSRYEEGRLGAGTIMRSFKAWARNKIKR